MKKILLTLTLSSSLAYAGNIEKVMHCISIGSGIDPVQHELIVSGDNSTHVYTYSYVKDRYINHSFLPDPYELIYESHGEVVSELFHNEPTYMFSNDHIHIFQLFGEDRGFRDDANNITHTFRASECELFPLQAPTPTPLDGTYDMQLTIDGKVFNDVMEIHGKEGPLAFTFTLKPVDVIGSVTVPGLFTSNLDGKFTYGPWIDFYFLNFSITANENGQSYKVNYMIEIDSATEEKFLNGEKNITLKGTAALENGEKLGDFIATRRD